MTALKSLALTSLAPSSFTLLAQDLVVQYAKEVQLSYPNLSLPAGAKLAITGPSGTGKTTFLHVLAGLITPQSGSVQFGDLSLYQITEQAREHYRRKHVGYVFQDFHLLNGLTALENVELGLRVAGITRAKQKAKEALAALDLAHRLNHRPAQLSTGERQRVAIARAVAHQPSLLLVDEPTAHLDRDRAGGAIELLLKTASDLKASLVVVTHDPLVAGLFPERLELQKPELQKLEQTGQP